MLLKYHKIISLLFVLFFLFLNCYSANEVVLRCKDKTIEVQIFGTKTHLSKLKKILDSEEKIFAQLDEEAGIKHAVKILSDTGLFEKVTDSTDPDGKHAIIIKDAYTLLPIVNFSTNLESFSYTIGASESDLFNDYWFISGAWSQSENTHAISYNFGVAYPTSDIQSIALGGYQGDNYFYAGKKWYRFDFEDTFMTIRFKEILGTQKFTYGLQLRYTQFEFIDDPTPSISGFMSLGKIYFNHDISEGYQFITNMRYIDDRYNRYAFNFSFQKNWYIPFKHSSYFRGTNVDYRVDYSNIEEDRSIVGAVFAFRNGSLHGLRSNSVFERNFGSSGVRFGVTSQKFLWTYWQPHIFMECGLSNHETYYSVGGGLLMTFPALYNSRLRIQYYVGELPDPLDGIIISTTLDF